MVCANCIMLNKLFLGIYSLSWLVASVRCNFTQKVYPQHVQSGVSEAIWESAPGLPLDGPKISIVNETVFDWWYFDAVSLDGSMQITIAFYNTNPVEFGFGDAIDTVNFVIFTAAFSNGTTFERYLSGNTASITTVGDGSSGIWNGSGASWTGSPDLTHYEVVVNAPEYGIKGSMVLKTIRRS